MKCHFALFWLCFGYLALSNDSSASTNVVSPPEKGGNSTEPSCLEEEEALSTQRVTPETEEEQHSGDKTEPNDNVEEDDEDWEDEEDLEDDEDWEEDEEDEDWEEDEEKELQFVGWEKTRFSLDDFTVAGVNLASYGTEDSFELYRDFDISLSIRGDEDWEELLEYRNKLTRPSISFYVDKVARKRWLPVMGYPQPDVKFLTYAEELTETGDLAEEIKVIQDALPTTGSFCAKPTHMSLTKGAWLVDHQEDGTTRFSLKGYALHDHGGKYDPNIVATKLAEGLHDGPDAIESWSLKNVKPGLVVEERWASHDDPTAPPHEFTIFTIWGRVWVGAWNIVKKDNRWCWGYFHRDGTAAPESYKNALPDWVPWKELVEIAESLGAHKDMFRTDMFVGHPVGADPNAPMQIAVSECEIFPTTVFTSPLLTREGARLWIAGYIFGIYELIDNDEVPQEFLEQGKLSDISKYRQINP